MNDGGGGRRRRPRQADIARLAGVSQATVSMVINHQGGKYGQIGEDTRRRVWEAVEELGYVADIAARTLAGGRNSILGLYTFEPVFPVDYHDFYYPFLVGIEEEAEQQGFDLLLFSSASGVDGNREIFRGGVNRLRVADGCVLLGRGGNTRELLRLARDPYPVVFIGRRELEGVDVSYVGADYVRATVEVVRHLAGLGHRRIALLSWGDQLEPTVDRLRGYELGCASAGVELERRLCRSVAAADVSTGLIEELVAAGATAVVAQDQAIASCVEKAANSLGMSLPADLSVAVLGDPPRGEPTGRAWTGFSIPRRDMGARALATLIEQLDAGDAARPVQTLLPCRFEPGATVAEAPASSGTSQSRTVS